MLIVIERFICTRFSLTLVVTAGRRDRVRQPRRHLFVNPIPHAVDNLLVVETLKDTVAPNQEEVIVVLKLETQNFRLANDNVLVASVSRPLRFDVAESARD
jgi:hypothetical protein